MMRKICTPNREFPHFLFREKIEFPQFSLTYTNAIKLYTHDFQSVCQIT